MTDDKNICDDHKACQLSINLHEKRLDGNRADHADMWKAIKDKISFKMFSLLVFVVIGNLGFQMAIYNSVKETEKSVAVIEARLKPNSLKIENKEGPN